MILLILRILSKFERFFILYQLKHENAYRQSRMSVMMISHQRDAKMLGTIAILMNCLVMTIHFKHIKRNKGVDYEF